MAKVKKLTVKWNNCGKKQHMKKFNFEKKLKLLYKPF